MASDPEQPVPAPPGARLPARPIKDRIERRHVLLEDAWLRLKIEMDIPDEAENARMITASVFATGTASGEDESASDSWLDVGVAHARGLEIPFIFPEDLHPDRIRDSVFWTCDAVNDNLMAAASSLTAHGAEACARAEHECSTGVLVMDFARVEPPFRGQGLGYMLLDAIRSATMGVNIVAIEPSPILSENEAEDAAAARKGLADFWSRAPYSGFEVLGDDAERPLLCLGAWTPNPFDIEALRKVEIPGNLILPE